MKNRARGTLTLLLVLVVLIAANYTVLRLGSPLDTADYGDGAGFADTFELIPLAHPFLYVPGSQLQVYPNGYATQVAVGTHIYFTVERAGEAYTPSQVTFEIVAGRDCAAAYVTGSVLGLGEGRVVVRAYLDADPTVYGYCALDVVQYEGTGGALTQTDVSSAPAGDADFEAMIAGFPESYKPYLRALHQKYPAWRFYRVDTGVDFFDAVYNETWLDKNKVNNWNPADIFKRKASRDYNFGSGERSAYDQYYDWKTGWVYGNELFVSTYLDPRNFLDERSVMQFESMRYNADLHTVEGVEMVLAGTFMHNAPVSYYDTEGNWVEVDKTHAQVLFEAGVAYGVSPYFLASKVRGEVTVGSQRSASVTGTYEGYEGYYNYFNIGAYDGLTEIALGLKTAVSNGWDTPEKAIYGGARFLANSYIALGQDTSYMQKYNVNANNEAELYQNQYMTNGVGAVDLGVKTYNGYAQSDMLQAALEFHIPVFSNMPAATTPATSLTLGGNANGAVLSATALRTGPAAFYPPVEGGQLYSGDIVRIGRCVATDAVNYSSYRLYHPYWYEITLIRDGQQYTGYVSEELVRRGSSDVLQPGETLRLTAALEPAGSDDVVRYMSENPNVATVSQDGTVMAVGSGTVVIVGYTSTGALDCYSLTVA